VIMRDLLAQVGQMATPKDGGTEVRQVALAKAQRIAQEELDALDWAMPDLQGRRKGVSAQGSDRLAFTTRNDHDVGVDSRAPAHGGADEPRFPTTPSQPEMVNIRL
jgi:hypothetical protein